MLHFSDSRIMDVMQPWHGLAAQDDASAALHLTGVSSPCSIEQIQ